MASNRSLFTHASTILVLCYVQGISGLLDKNPNVQNHPEVRKLNRWGMKPTLGDFIAKRPLPYWGAKSVGFGQKKSFAPVKQWGVDSSFFGNMQKKSHTALEHWGLQPTSFGKEKKFSMPILPWGMEYSTQLKKSSPFKPWGMGTSNFQNMQKKSNALQHWGMGTSTVGNENKRQLAPLRAWVMGTSSFSNEQKKSGLNHWGFKPMFLNGKKKSFDPLYNRQNWGAKFSSPLQKKFSTSALKWGLNSAPFENAQKKSGPFVSYGGMPIPADGFENKRSNFRWGMPKSPLSQNSLQDNSLHKGSGHVMSKERNIKGAVKRSPSMFSSYHFVPVLQRRFWSEAESPPTPSHYQPYSLQKWTDTFYP